MRKVPAWRRIASSAPTSTWAALALQQHAAELSQPARLRLARAAGALHALSPLAVLERGYAVVTANGQVIRAAAQVEVASFEVETQR